jgi:hypothetical protein
MLPACGVIRQVLIGIDANMLKALLPFNNIHEPTIEVSFGQSIGIITWERI